MLAQNFQTPTELQISNAEYNALVHILGMMERGELKHHHVGYYQKLVGPPPKFSGLFNMCHVKTVTSCGTVACILGAAQLLFGDDLFAEQWCNWKYQGTKSAVSQLFVPEARSDYWLDITVEQAATALRNYLTTGEASWATVMEG